MTSFPVTVVDNFFDNPDSIRQFALTQKFERDPKNTWPGLRTKQIHELNRDLFMLFSRKVISIFYDTVNTNVEWFMRSAFQLVDKESGSGWIHIDSGTTYGSVGSLAAGIIFLTPDAPLNSGTSIYRLKKDRLCENLEYNQVKEQFYEGKITKQEAEVYREKHNNQFEEVVRVSNIYNRLIFFGGNEFHGAQDFFGKDSDSRLTLVFFIDHISTMRTPFIRMKEIK